MLPNNISYLLFGQFSSVAGKTEACVDLTNGNDETENENDDNEDENEDDDGEDENEDDEVEIKIEKKMAKKLAAFARSPEFKKKSALASSKSSVAKVVPYLPLPSGAYASVVHLADKPVPWYSKSAFVMMMFQEGWNIVNPEKKDRFPAWALNWMSHPLRVEHDLANSMVHKKNSTYPMERISFIVVTKHASEEEVRKQLSIIDSYREQIFAIESGESEIGPIFLKHCYETNDTAIFSGLDKYIPANDEARKKTMTKDFVEFGRKRYQYEFGYTLDNFWTDGTIKEFVKKWWNVFSFEELSEEVLKKCYRNYPTRRLPVWHDVVEQMLRG